MRHPYRPRALEAPPERITRQHRAASDTGGLRHDAAPGGLVGSIPPRPTPSSAAPLVLVGHGQLVRHTFAVQADREKACRATNAAWEEFNSRCDYVDAVAYVRRSNGTKAATGWSGWDAEEAFGVRIVEE
jgi:hypothetical protein